MSTITRDQIGFAVVLFGFVVQRLIMGALVLPWLRDREIAKGRAR